MHFFCILIALKASATVCALGRRVLTSKYHVSEFIKKIENVVKCLFGNCRKLETSMSVLFIVEPKCTVVALHAAPLAVTVSMPTGQTDRRTDGRTPDCYITLSTADTARVISSLHQLRGGSLLTC